MAERVFVHLGVPKSGTTYLQSSMWNNKELLRQHGVLLPGARRQEHTWSTFAVREDPALLKRGPAALDVWDRITGEVAAWPATAVISHEFFGAATAEQAGRALAALSPAEVHLVVTARDALSLLTASWQETLKYRAVTPLRGHNRAVSASPLDVWNWRNLDASEVLSRWARTVPPERVHVVVLPRTPSSETEYWQRFAGLFMEHPDRVDVTSSARNTSMGLVEAELLRLLNTKLPPDPKAIPTHTWLRDYVANEQLVRRKGQPFWPLEEQIEECRARSEEMVNRIQRAGYHVVGGLEDLLVPAELPPRRTPEQVTDRELAEAGAEVLAAVLTDLRATTATLRRAERRNALLRQSPQERKHRGRLSIPAATLGARWIRGARNRLSKGS